jgi:hypothetical protein
MTVIFEKIHLSSISTPPNRGVEWAGITTNTEKAHVSIEMQSTVETEHY